MYSALKLVYTLMFTNVFMKYVVLLDSNAWSPVLCYNAKAITQHNRRKVYVDPIIYQTSLQFTTVTRIWESITFCIKYVEKHSEYKQTNENQANSQL